MKILHLLQSNHFSGAENVVCQIVDMMGAYSQYEMVYCSPDGQIRQSLQDRGVIYVPIEKWSISGLRKVLREQKPDLIHAHDRGATFLAALACGKTPMISHFHNNAVDSRKINARSVGYYLAALKARHIFWVSQSALEGYRFHKWLQKKSTVLYNIINVDAVYQRMAQDAAEYAYDIVYLGRLSYQKNPQRLMQVLAKIVEKKPNLKVAVVGTGELEEATKAACSHLGIEENVMFLGFCGNPLKILHDAQLMLMVSRFEGTPMCALEAMALGVPIVSTPTDGLCDLVVNGQTGYLCEDDEALVNSCLRILSSGELRKAMSEASLERSREMNNAQNYCKALNDAYQK